jgi:hypothetical protein
MTVTSRSAAAVVNICASGLMRTAPRSFVIV